MTNHNSLLVKIVIITENTLTNLSLCGNIVSMVTVRIQAI